MKREEKERVVAGLAERLRSSQTLIVADYRGLTMPQIDTLRSRLLEHGARFTVVKNTLTRRAAEAAGAETLLALLDGPTAIAFLDSDGDPVAVAKALADAARETRVLTVRGGVLEGRALEAAEIEELAKLPPADILRGQVLGAVTAPLTNVLALFTTPLQDLYGLLDARIDQLQAEGDVSAEAPDVEQSPPGSEVDEATESEDETPQPDAEASAAAPENEEVE